MHALALLLFTLALLAPTHPNVQDDAACKLRGRFVDEQGVPVAEVTVNARGWVGNSARLQAHGQPQDWRNPEPVTTGADGRFELEFVPPRAFQFTLDAKHANFGKVAWRWSELAPGSDVELGDTRLEAPAVVVGSVLDADGGLLVEGWTVSASHSWQGGGNRVQKPRSSCTSRAPIDPETGAFRIDDLPPGRLRLSAENRSGVHIGELWIDTRAGVENEVQLVYRGPDPSRRIVLSVRSTFFGMKPALGTVHAVDLDGTRHALEPAPGRASDWHALDLEPGAYTLEVRDPRFEPWTREGVHTGTKNIAHLQGSATVQLVVLPSEGAAPLEAYGLLVTYEGVWFSPSRFTLAEAGAEAPKDGLFTGIVPGEVTLEVRAEGAAPRVVQLGTIKPGETRSVEVTLGGGRVLEGRVLNVDGSPATGLRVQLTRGEFPGTDQPGRTSGGMLRVDGVMKQYNVGYRDREVETDAEGRFRFTELGTGPHALRAIASTWAQVDQVVNLDPGDARGVQIELPALGAIELEILFPEGIDPTRAVLSVQPTDSDAPGLPPFMGGGPTGKLDAEGRALLEGVPAGEVEFSIMCPGLMLELGTLELAPGARVPHRVDARDSEAPQTTRPRRPVPVKPPAEPTSGGGGAVDGHVVHGRVLHADGSPAADVRVQLTRGEFPGTDEPGSMSSGSTLVNGVRKRYTIAYRDHEVVSDADGRFRFPGCAPGPYALRAIVNPHVKIDRVVRAGADEARDVQLDAPPLATLELEVTFPEGEDASGWRVNVAPADEEPSGMVVRTGTDGTALDRSGRVVLEGLPAVATQVVLRWAKWGRGGPPKEKSIELDVLELVRGERLVHAFDARERYPAGGRLRVTCAGGTPQELWVSLLRAPDDATGLPYAVIGGVGSLEDIVPGEYTLRVRNDEAGWVWRDPTPLVIAPGSAFERELHVPLVERELRVVDAEGAPLAGVELTWWIEPLRPGRAQAATDEHGVFTLRLAPGTVHVARADSLERAVELRWEAGDERVELELSNEPR